MLDERNSSKGIVIEESNLENDMVSIRCLKPMIVRVTGAVTGNKYVFRGAGSIEEVDEKDVESIMSKNRRTQSCCGSYSSPYFEIL